MRADSSRGLSQGRATALRTGLAASVGALLGLGAPGCGNGADPVRELPPVVFVEPSPEAAAAPAPDAGPRRALWVLAEGARRVLEHPDRIAGLLRDAEDLGATDLYVQVYRAGRAWFDSDLADASPYWKTREAHDVDSLALLLERAADAGLRVHAWVNALSLAENADAPLLAQLGRGAVLVDREGRSLLDYPGYDVPEPDRRYYRMGTPGIYLDAAAPGVAEELVAVFSELLERYPAFDGLHLDYIRYPDVLPFAPGSRFGVGLDFGYGEATRARFREETSREAPLGRSLANANAWDAWRRERLSALVAEVAAAARAARPGVEISAAVWTYADRAYLVLGQDWRLWLEEGWLDRAVPMSYTVDDRLLRYMAEHFAGRPDAARITVGLGTWLFAERPEGALEQIRIVRTAGVRDVALFSWDSIATAPALREALVAELGPAPEAAPDPERAPENSDGR